MLKIGTRIVSVVSLPDAPPPQGVIKNSTVICGKVSYYILWDNGGEIWVPEDMVKECP